MLLLAWPCLAQVVTRQCLGGDCASLAVVGKMLEFRTTGTYEKARAVGEYASGAQRLVPKGEAPIRMLKGKDGLTVVITASLPEFDEYGPAIGIRVYDHALRQVFADQAGDDQNRLDTLELKSVGADQMVAMGTSGEHRYDAQILVWLLPARGLPTRVFDAPGSVRRFSVTDKTQAVELVIARQTYDGVDAKSIGERLEQWRWDRERRSFHLAP